MTPQLPLQNIPRPTFADVFASYAEPSVLRWITSLKGTMTDEKYEEFLGSLPTGEKTLRQLLHSLAYGTARDSFAYCDSLRKVLDWPVNGDLAEIFSFAIKQVNAKELRREQINWVMATGHRFPVKVGEKVTFAHGEANRLRSATVIEVDRPIAAAKVKLVLEEKLLTVNAEDVVL